METDTNVSTSVENTENVESTPHDEIDAEIDNLTLDNLLEYTQEDDPLFTDDAKHKGMKPLNEWIHNVPEDVRKHLANIRADYTRKTQELSRMRKEVEEAQSKARLQNENIINGPLAKQLAEVNTDEEYDLFDAEGMKKEIQRQAALMLKQMLQPAQEELEVQQRRLQLDAFKAQHPELTSPEYRGPIVEMLQARPELTLEDAFYIVKAKVDSQKATAERAELAERKARQREVVTKSSSGTRTAPSGTPKFKSAVEAYKYWKAQSAKN